MTPHVVGTVRRPLFSVEGTLVMLENDNIQIFEYSKDKTGAVSEDISKLVAKYSRTSRLRNLDNSVNLYRKGPLIIFYLGSNKSILLALDGAIGPRIVDNFAFVLR